MTRFPRDGGQMGRAIAAFDWGPTALGPIDTWPDTLRSTVNLMLDSPFAICIASGPELTFLYNDAFIPVLGQRHGDALGKKIKDVWWDVWDSIGPWIDKALGGGTVQLEDAPLTMQRNGYPEETWWTFAHSPLSDADGNIHGFLCVCIETTEKFRSTRQLASEQGRLRQLFDTSPSFMALMTGPDHRFELTNSGYQKLVGERSVIGSTVAEVLGEAVEQGYLDILDTAYRTGEPYFGTEAKFALQLDPDGPVVDRFVDFVYQPLRDENGAVFGIFLNGVDVTERRKSDRDRDVLHREMVHRVKNTMAVTSAVVSASLRHASTLEEARDTVTARIEALGRSHAMLTRPEGDADVQTVIREAIAPLVETEDQVTIEGPHVNIGSQQAVGLSLALYELGTNALKYGALSVPDGRVSIEWQVGPEKAFEFVWRESGGPVVQAPIRTGFGSRLTNRIVPAYFYGSSETRYDPQGVKYALRGTISAGFDDTPELDKGDS